MPAFDYTYPDNAVDRAMGEVLSATAYVRITGSKGVDLKTGRLQYAEDKEPKMGKVVRPIQPASPGVKDWQPSAYSPRSGWLYVPHQNLAMDYEAVEANYIAGTPFVGVNLIVIAGRAETRRACPGTGDCGRADEPTVPATLGQRC